jgi:hypothetical protein
MQFISESIIDTLIERYEDEKNYLDDFATLINEQPDVRSWLDQENYSLLSKEELVLLEYLSCIIYFSCKKGLNTTLVIPGKILDKWEEDNWDVFNTTNVKNFSKILDVFFEKYPQEDLLALVEDSIQPDDDKVVTSVGSEIIFVACKSLIDTLHQLN